MNFTVKENGVRVANGSFKGTRVNADQIRSHYENLLGELGFVLDRKTTDERLVYIHQSTIPMSPFSLCVSWREEPCVLSIHRGDFIKNHKIGGEYDLHDFVDSIIQSLRDVWAEGCEVVIL